MRIKAIVEKALKMTAALWPDIEVAAAWMRKVGRVLRNEAGESGDAVRRRLAGLVGSIARHRAAAPTLAAAIDHFLKVTRSYWNGLFFCYDVPGLERTNNALEQLFGSWRWHQRRSTGRKTAARTTVLRGPVSLVAQVATRIRPISARELAQTDIAAWRQKRRQLEQRRRPRLLGAQWKRTPETYLANLEAEALKLTLPS